MGQPIRQLELFIKGASKPLPVDWQEIGVELLFDGVFTNPIIDTLELNLVNEAAFAVLDHIDNGDIYEGIEAKLKYSEDSDSEIFFDGYIDCSQNYEVIDPDFGDSENPVEVKVTFTPKYGRDHFQDKIDGTTFGLLDEKGVFSANDYTDIDFVIEDDFDPFKFFFTLWMIFQMGDKINQLVRDLSQDIAAFASYLAAGVTGSAAAVIYQTAMLIIRTAYALLLVGTMVVLMVDFATTIISPLYTNKGQSLESLLSKAINYLGFEFESRIPLLADIYFNGGTPFDDEANLVKQSLPFPPLIKKGIPQVSDAGFILSDLITSVTTLFNAKLTLEGDKVILLNDKDDLLTKPSGLDFGSLKTPTKKYNSDELNRTNVLEFVYDTSEKWTIRNWKGNSFELFTESTSANPIQGGIKGLNRAVIPYALATRKSELSIVEETVLAVLKVAETLSEVFGQKKSFTNLITNRIGVAKFSGNMNTVPKLIYMKGGRIPANHRDVFSAKPIFKNYHQSKSWIADNYDSQEAIHEGVTLPNFKLSDFKTMYTKRTFATSKGLAYPKRLKYAFGSNQAVSDYRIKEVYTTKLREVEIEQQNE